MQRSARETIDARDLSLIEQAPARSISGANPAKLIDADGASVEAPAELVDVLIAIVRQLQANNGISVAALHTDLTTVEAVELASGREIRLTLRVRTGKLNPWQAPRSESS